MKEESIVLRKLTAAEGYILTNGEAYGKEIYLGKNDSPAFWYEIPEADYQAIMEKEEKENV